MVACLPTWNAANYIKETLESLLSQSYPNLEILISDDCSTDNTAQICRQTAASDARVEIQIQPRNTGWINNVNGLLSRANGVYVFIAAHDDLLHPDYVSCLVEALESNPDAVLAFTDMDVEHLDGSVEIWHYTQLDNVINPVLRAASILLQIGRWWVPYRGIFRRSVLTECVGLKHHGAGEFSADWPWVLSLVLRGQFVRIPKMLYHKRYKKNSLSRTWDFNLWSWIKVYISCMVVIDESKLPIHNKLFLYLVSVLYVPRRALGYIVYTLRRP